MNVFVYLPGWIETSTEKCQNLYINLYYSISQVFSSVQHALALNRAMGISHNCQLFILYIIMGN